MQSRPITSSAASPTDSSVLHAQAVANKAKALAMLLAMQKRIAASTS